MSALREDLLAFRSFELAHSKQVFGKALNGKGWYYIAGFVQMDGLKRPVYFTDYCSKAPFCTKKRMFISFAAVGSLFVQNNLVYRFSHKVMQIKTYLYRTRGMLLILFFSAILSTLGFSQDKSDFDRVLEQVETAFEKGDTQALSRLIADPVELSVTWYQRDAF